MSDELGGAATGSAPGGLRGRLRSPAGLILAGLVLGQGVVYLVTPWLTRVYSAGDIGLAAAMLAAASIAATVGTLRLELLLPAARTEARWLAKWALVALLIAAVVTAPAVAGLLGLSAVDGILYAVMAVTIGSTAVTLQMSARVGRLTGVAVAKASQGVVQSGAQLALAVPAPAIGMQVGIAAGGAAAALAQGWGAFGRFRSLESRTPAGAERRSIWRQAGLLTVAAACNALVVSALPIVVQALYSSAEAGELAVAQRLALAPAGLFTAALLPVFIAGYGAARRAGGDRRGLVLRWLRVLVPAGLLVAVALVALSFVSLEWLLGPGWDQVGSYLGALSLLIGTQIAVGPISQLLVIEGRARVQLLWDAARLAAVAVSVLMSYTLWHDAVATTWAMASTVAAFQLIFLWIAVRSASSAVPAEKEDA